MLNGLCAFPLTPLGDSGFDDVEFRRVSVSDRPSVARTRLWGLPMNLAGTKRHRLRRIVGSWR